MHNVVFNWSIASVGTSTLWVGVSDGKYVENLEACLAHARSSESVVKQNTLWKEYRNTKNNGHILIHCLREQQLTSSQSLSFSRLEGKVGTINAGGIRIVDLNYITRK